jgi:hypothetical protein
MARRIAPEFNVTRIMRPVTTPVDTFYNLAPLAQTAPVDTQSLEIADALRELSPSLMGMAQALHSRETRLGVEDYMAMTPEERKAFVELEKNRTGIMPQRTIATLQEHARQAYVLEYRRRALAEVDSLSEPYNPDGTIRTLDAAQLRLQELSDSMGVPDSYYIKRAYLDGKRAVDAEIMSRVTEGQISKAQARTEEQFVTRALEAYATISDPEQLADYISKAADGFYKQGLIPDGARNALYKASSNYVTALLSSPRLDDADIDRAEAILATLMEPQTDPEGKPYRGIRGMPLPPELYAQYEQLQDSLADASVQVTLRANEEAVRLNLAPLLDNWSQNVEQSRLASVPSDPVLREFISVQHPDLSGSQLSALFIAARSAMQGMVRDRIQPPIGVDAEHMDNLRDQARYGQLTSDDLYKIRDLTPGQRQELLGLVSGPFSTPGETADSPGGIRQAVSRVQNEVVSLNWLPFDPNSLSKTTQSRLGFEAARQFDIAVQELEETISKDSELMALKATDPLEYSRRINDSLSQIRAKVSESMGEMISAAASEAEARILGLIAANVSGPADSYVASYYADSPEGAPAAAVASLKQEFVDRFREIFTADPRPFSVKETYIPDFITQTIFSLETDKARQGISTPPLMTAETQRALRALDTQDQIIYSRPDDPSALAFPDLPNRQGVLSWVFSGTPAPYTPDGWLERQGLYDLFDAVVDAEARMVESNRTADFLDWTDSKQRLADRVSQLDMFSPTRTLYAKSRTPEGGTVTRTMSVPLFQFRSDGIYVLPTYIDGTYNPSPSSRTLLPLGIGPAVEDRVAALPERIASRIDDYRVKDPKAMAMWMSIKQRNFGSLDQLVDLTTDEGVKITPGLGDTGVVQFDPRKTRFFNSREELVSAVDQYREDFTGPLQIVLEYTEYKIKPEDLIQAQTNLIESQVP